MKSFIKWAFLLLALILALSAFVGCNVEEEDTTTAQGGEIDEYDKS